LDRTGGTAQGRGSAPRQRSPQDNARGGTCSLLSQPMCMHAHATAHACTGRTTARRPSLRYGPARTSGQGAGDALAEAAASGAPRERRRRWRRPVGRQPPAGLLHGGPEVRAARRRVAEALGLLGQARRQRRAQRRQADACGGATGVSAGLRAGLTGPAPARRCQHVPMAGRRLHASRKHEAAQKA
jgi:hypothetical protein